MAKTFVLLAAIAFLINFAAFMLALISRYNIKKMMMTQGKNPSENFPDFPEMQKIDNKTARQYQIAIRFWTVSLIILIISIVAVYLYK